MQTLPPSTFRALRSRLRGPLQLGAACLLLLSTLAGAQPPQRDVIRPENPDEALRSQARPIEVVPPVPEARKPVPRAQRIAVKGQDGKVTYVYKCGDEFTDSPVCTAPVKPSTMRATPAEMARCKTLNNGNFIPWYCR